MKGKSSRNDRKSAERKIEKGERWSKRRKKEWDDQVERREGRVSRIAQHGLGRRLPV